MKEKSKRGSCKFYHPLMGRNHNESHCVVDGWEDDKVKTITKADCETCEKYKSRYIEYPIMVNEIENKPIELKGLFHEVGSLCEICPCGEEYEGKTYIGFYLGDLPLQILTSYREETGVLTNYTMTNPAIFVPELKKIIFGCESWWRVIDSVDNCKGISKDDIENTWYVQLLKTMEEQEEKK